ncbi:MAG: hypothetical protein KDK96_09630 [Chlamydiia bacterium]|nr:hypothetical protein [Chlamydiia bacterium]
MLQPLKDSSFSHWQSVVLQSGVVVLAILFLAVIAMVLFRPQKKEVEDKWHSAFCLISLALMSAFTLLFTLTISFVIEVKLGWQLSLLAGASVVLGAISLSTGFVISFTKTSMKHTYLWGALGMTSVASILILSIQALSP